MSEKTPARVDSVRLQNLTRAFMGSASIFAALDLELFTAVSAGDNTTGKFARRANISEVNADRLMTMCASQGLLYWVDDHYENADDTQRFLVKGERSYAGAWLTFTRPSWSDWGKLTEKLQNSEPAKVIGGYEGMTVEYARTYHEATASIGFGAGRRFVKQVDLSKRKKMMDLGGGSGAYSIVAAQAHPKLKAVVFDLPPVAVITGEYIAKYDVADQVSAQGGDFTKDDFPEGCDVAIMASNLPQYNREIINQVIQKAYDALLPGGEMHLIGEMLDDDRQGPTDAAIWGLFEVMSNSTGIAHTRADCVSYFERAGFTDVQVNDFIPGTLARTSGRKK